MAAMLLRTRSLLPSYVQNDYEKFKSNFLQSFGVSEPDSFLEWAMQFADMLPGKASRVSTVSLCISV